MPADVERLAEKAVTSAPHIFAERPGTPTLAQEEIFGPVLAVHQSRQFG